MLFQTISLLRNLIILSLNFSCSTFLYLILFLFEWSFMRVIKMGFCVTNLLKPQMPKYILKALLYVNDNLAGYKILCSMFFSFNTLKIYLCVFHDPVYVLLRNLIKIWVFIFLDDLFVFLEVFRSYSIFDFSNFTKICLGDFLFLFF